MIKKILKNITPPFILKMLKNGSKYGFFGNYKNWSKASKDAVGYDSPAIIDKVKNSSLKVRDGRAAYERDSVPFKTKEYVWPVLAYLLHIASKNRNKL